MAELHELIEKIENPELRAQIAEAAKRALKHKQFGLVFEEHLPECTPLYDIPVRKGLKVSVRNGKASQYCEPKKISVRKTPKPHRFRGFVMPFFKVKFKRYHFPKTTFGEDLNCRPRLLGADFALFFARFAPFFVSGFVKCLCLGGCA